MSNELGASFINGISMAGDGRKSLGSSPTAIAVANNGEMMKIVWKVHGLVLVNL